MIKFFRKIRQRLLEENRFSKYLLYATGEIILVVIGILVALQINNLNESNKQSKRERSLLEELKTNLATNVRNLESDITIQNEGASAIHYLLEYIDNKRPYIDTLDGLFQDADFVPDVVLSSSAFETLKSSGLEIIQNNNLRKEVINLFEVNYPYLIQETRRLEDQTWSSTSVPLYQRHFRREIRGKARPINYESLLNDQEFTNMLSFRLLLRESSTVHKQNAINETNEVINLIIKELGK